MNFIKLLENWTRWLHASAYDQKETYFNRWKEEEQKRHNIDVCWQESQNKVKKQEDKIIALQMEVLELKESSQTEMDTYLSSKYVKTKNLAYKYKREVNDTLYSVYNNQMITPHSFELLKFKKPFEKYKDVMVFMQHAGDKLSKITTWVDETKIYKHKDRYFYPEETLTGMKDKIDCEDLAFTIASLKPEICGVCYGFYEQNGKSFGHAYPCFLYDNKLFIAETTRNSVEIVPFTDKRYKTYFIVTKDNTYRVRSGVSFGKIASM